MKEQTPIMVAIWVKILLPLALILVLLCCVYQALKTLDMTALYDQQKTLPLKKEVIIK